MRAFLFLTLGLMIGLVSPALAQDCSQPDLPLRPVAKTHLVPPYPPMSQTTGEEGTSLLEVKIGADGVPIDASVATSSGSARLDEAAMDYVKANWRWQPPVKNCQPVIAVTRVSIKWDLRESDPASQPITIVPGRDDFPPGAQDRKEQGMTYLIVQLYNTGAVHDSRVVRSSGFTDLDDKAAQLARARHYTPAMVDGKPSTASLVLGFNWQLNPN